MKKTKKTISYSQGPWTHDDDDFHVDTDGTRFVDLNGPANQPRPRFARIDAGETAKADALLIAAAPDLLAALQQIVKDWDSVDPCEPVPDEINEDSHWESARAAIAKALGQ